MLLLDLVWFRFSFVLLFFNLLLCIYFETGFLCVALAVLGSLCRPGRPQTLPLLGLQARAKALTSVQIVHTEVLLSANGSFLTA